jgi:hypothetical protein
LGLLSEMLIRRISCLSPLRRLPSSLVQALLVDFVEQQRWIGRGYSRLRGSFTREYAASDSPQSRPPIRFFSWVIWAAYWRQLWLWTPARLEHFQGWDTPSSSEQKQDSADRERERTNPQLPADHERLLSLTHIVFKI